jgi:hypothetical protein
MWDPGGYLVRYTGAAELDFVDPADGNDVLSSISRIPHNLIEARETMTQHDLRLLHLVI